MTDSKHIDRELGPVAQLIGVQERVNAAMARGGPLGVVASVAYQLADFVGDVDATVPHATETMVSGFLAARRA